MKFYICSGSQENWETAFIKNIWGVKKRFKKLWGKLKKGDILIFYVSSPINGFVGMGKIKDKFEQKNPLWPEEIKTKKVIWPYRFEFSIEFVLPKSEWKTKKVSLDGLKLSINAGLNPVKNLNDLKLLFKRMDEAWETKLFRLIEGFTEESKPKKVNLHEEIKEKLMELGEVEGYIVEKEYKIPEIDERLDVVWKKLEGGTPKYAFEIQLKGNLYQALVKLKNAYVNWNSRIYLITTKDSIEKVYKLINSSFHEIKDRIKIISVEKFNEFYDLETKANKLKKELEIVEPEN
jgi:predicted RNA-binding protein